MNYCYVYISIYLLFFIDTVIAQSLFINDKTDLDKLNLEDFVKHHAWTVSTSEKSEWNFSSLITDPEESSLFNLTNLGTQQEEWSILTIEDLPIHTNKFVSLNIPLECNLSGEGTLTISYFTGKEWISVKNIQNSFIGTIKISLKTIDTEKLSIKFIYHSSSNVAENVYIRDLFPLKEFSTHLAFLKVFPNPSSIEDNISITIPNLNTTALASNKVSLKLRDVKGQLLLNELTNISRPFMTRELLTKDLEPGIYFLEVSIDEHTWHEKLIIQ